MNAASESLKRSGFIAPQKTTALPAAEPLRATWRADSISVSVPCVTTTSRPAADATAPAIAARSESSISVLSFRQTDTTS